MVPQPESVRRAVGCLPAWRWCVAGALVAATLAGCNRIALIRPDTSRGDFERTAPEVAVRDRPRRSEPGIDALVIDGQRRLAAGDLDSAEQLARQAMKRDAASSVPHTLMAMVAEARGELAQAGRSYEKAVALAPDRGSTLNNYGAWLCRNGRATESLDHFQRALADPAYATPVAALANLGACAHEVGDARADAALERAVALEPVNPLALEVLAERKLKAGDLLRARAFSERRLAAAPATARVLRIASQIEDSLGDRRAAEAYRRRLRVEFPHDASETDAMGHNGAK